MEYHPPRYSAFEEALFQTTYRESESLREQLREIYLLHSAAKAFNASLQGSHLAQNLHDLLEFALHIDEFGLLLENPRTGSYELWYGDMRDPQSDTQAGFRPGEGVSGRVAQEGQPILVPDISRSEHFRDGGPARDGSFLAVPLFHSDGRVFGVLNSYRYLSGTFQDRDKELLTAVGHNLAPAIERIRLYEDARNEALRDELTGLHNRRFFRENATLQLRNAHRRGEPMAVLIADLDKFKTINDRFGHAAGDIALVGLGNLLTETVRENDLVARFGGEEIVALLPDTGLEGAGELAEKVRHRVEETSLIGDDPTGPGGLTVTIGVAAYPQDGDTLEALLNTADQRMFLGKSRGRNQVVGGTPPQGQPAPDERRRHPRYGAALRLADSRQNSAPALHSLEIQSGREWYPCGLADVSRDGFRALLAFPPPPSSHLRCRAWLDSDGPRTTHFDVQIRHARLPPQADHPQVGVRVEPRDADTWDRVFEALAH